ncbi:hypothetical protein, partial [Streptococcus pneumoniae]|uniref:hypothetical protein n=1 Tax=Streptococcus pneumoniae TaxID=1313 RepID=UPI0007099D33
LKNAWTTSRQVNFFWVANFNLKFGAISSISKLASCCIVAKDLSKNTMKLDVIFFEDKNKRSAVLGLRRDKSGVFKPVTLHFTSAKKYAKVRKTDVKEMKWL